MRKPAQRADERFDVVDAQDRVVGQAARGEVHARGWLHRAVHILWRRSDGQLCLQRRSYAKDTCPGLLSSSCAGHVDAGEGYDQAALRELGEELGLAVNLCDLVEIDTCRAHADLGNEFVRVYLLVGDRPARPCPAEVDALLWRSPAEVEAWVRHRPHGFSSSFLHLLSRPGVRGALGLPARLGG